VYCELHNMRKRARRRLPLGFEGTEHARPTDGAQEKAHDGGLVLIYGDIVWNVGDFVCPDITGPAEFTVVVAHPPRRPRILHATAFADGTARRMLAPRGLSSRVSLRIGFGCDRE
jgi:hypothetical protein